MNSEDIRKSIFEEIKLTKEEERALKEAHTSIQGLKKEESDELKILEYLDKRINETRNLLHDVNIRLEKVKQIVDSSKEKVTKEDTKKAEKSLIEISRLNKKLDELMMEFEQYEISLWHDKEIKKNFIAVLIKHLKQLQGMQKYIEIEYERIWKNTHLVEKNK